MWRVIRLCDRPQPHKEGRQTLRRFRRLIAPASLADNAHLQGHIGGGAGKGTISAGQSGLRRQCSAVVAG